MTQTVKWGVSLSNGETLYQGKGIYEEIEGELSAWQRLVSYLAQNRLEITSLFLYQDSGRRWNLPSAGSNPKFAVLQNLEKPLDFNCFCILGMNMKMSEKEEIPDHFIVIEAIYSGGKKLQIWVNLRNPEISYSILL